LYQELGLPLPTSPASSPFPIFIYGGSTAMGISGIQYAKASGLTVVTTASPKNHDYLKSLGADAIFDYKSPTLVEDVRAAVGDDCKYAWDCHATEASAKICAAVLSKKAPGKYSALLYGTEDVVRKENPAVEPHVSLYYSAFGEPYFYKGPKEPQPEQLKFATGFWDLSRKLLADGVVKPIRVVKNQGGAGLEGVIKGLDDLRDGKYSAAKLVYTL
jgi:NADPH:quinone reductase-like Zn-dependent oxidoreductase